jgi:hypothetical protein
MRLFATGAVLLAVLAAGAGCATSEESAPSPTPTPPASSPSSPAPTEVLPTSTLATGTAGSDGLTVRYRDHDGSLKTVRVEDFPR